MVEAMGERAKMGYDHLGSIGMKPFAHATLLIFALLIFSGGLSGAIGGANAEGLDQNTEARKWIAGLYTFSDEHGGMRIVSVTGKGTMKDPAIITQDVQSIGPNILTIRMLAAPGVGWTSLHLEIRAVNRSQAGWIGYHLELQEEFGKASIYGDGLSFNQLTRRSDNVLSSRFSSHELEYEPGDRLVFNDGWVDQSDMVDFRFFVLDLTPSPVFYIQQIPRIPSS